MSACMVPMDYLTEQVSAASGLWRAALSVRTQQFAQSLAAYRDPVASSPACLPSVQAETSSKQLPTPALWHAI